MGWLAQLLADETDSPSSKRLVGILCALSLNVALFVNLFHPAHPEPSALLVDAIGLYGAAALGLTTWDKARALRGDATSSTSIVAVKTNLAHPGPPSGASQ